MIRALIISCGLAIVLAVCVTTSTPAVAGGAYSFSFGYSNYGGHHYPYYGHHYRYSRPWSYSFGYTYYAPPVYYYSAPPPPPLAPVYQYNPSGPVYYYSGGSFYRY